MPRTIPHCCYDPGSKMRASTSRRIAVAILLLTGGAWLAAQGQPAASGDIYLLSVQDAIGPATSDYIQSGIESAAAAGASLVLLELDTPGGLDTSMREIIQAILVSPVPVATYVYPAGARAASAGTYILYASHVAAMTPATNLGAATPVAIGGGSPLPMPGSSDPGDTGDDAADQAAPEPGSTSDRKAINDAVAYIRSLAERRGRNADWAERAVRQSESLSAEAALAAGVIDLIAADRTELISRLNGRVIDGRRLTLANATIVPVQPDWRNRLLAVISNPTIAYMLLLLGIYGLIFEGYNPGAIVPGVVGAVSLLLALFALQILPVNFAGVALIVLGLILMLAEFFVPSFGALGIGGTAAFVFGSLILFDRNIPGFEVARSLIASLALASSLLLMATVWFALRARNQQVVSGVEQMSGMLAEALEDFDREGAVWVHGERWRARTSTPVARGQAVKVTQVEGLLLNVEPLNGSGA